MDFETLPEVAVTDRVYVPTGVPFVFDVDLMEAGAPQPIDETVNASKPSRKRPVSLRRLREMPSMIMPNGISASPIPFGSKPSPARATMPTVAELILVVLTVNVNAPGVPGVATTEAGPVQVAPLGAPEQLNDNVSESLKFAPPVTNTCSE